MRVLLFNKKQKLYDKSGVGRAMKHQVKALTEAGIPFTVNEKTDFDIVHINTIDQSAFRMARKLSAWGKKLWFMAIPLKKIL